MLIWVRRIVVVRLRRVDGAHQGNPAAVRRIVHPRNEKRAAEPADRGRRLCVCAERKDEVVSHIGREAEQRYGERLLRVPSFESGALDVPKRCDLVALRRVRRYEVVVEVEAVHGKGTVVALV